MSEPQTITAANASHSSNAVAVVGPSRRELMRYGTVLAAGAGMGGAMAWWSRREGGMRADVFIGKAEGYDARLVDVITDGLRELGIEPGEVRGRRVLLKPNLVETAPGFEHINTHPAVVVAAAEAFRRLGAGSVLVAEGQGHRRDSWLVLEESGMAGALDEAGLAFHDLNHDAFRAVANAGGRTHFATLYLPQTLLAADWVVSVAKMKTHHWAGMTCAMKNLFGVMPGVVYGWPKNPLHHAGIEQSIYDINATVRPNLAIVDGVVGMEGDGPIMGTPKKLGCIVLGRQAAAVDATCARLMGLRARGVRHLALASGRLGPIRGHNITQRGESIETSRTSFSVLDLPHLQSVRKSKNS